MWLIALQDGAGDALGPIGDVLAPLGGVALLALCIRLAVAAYREMAITARDREQVCTDTLAGMVPAMTALTDELRRGGDGHAQQMGEVRAGMGEINVALVELLQHARAARGDPR